METKDTLSSCSNSEEQQMQQIQDKAKKSCMVSFRQLHSHLKLLSNNDLKGTRTECGFKRAFATLFGQDVETFTGTMFLNMDQLEKQLDKEEFQEIGSMAAFKIPEFRDTLIQHMESVKKSIDKRALHKREYDSWVNERQMQTTEEKVDTSKALDANLVDTESSGIESKEQDTSSRSGNDAHADDADIKPVYDEEPMAEVQLTAKINVLATGQQHTEQPELNNEGEVDQNAEQCHDTCPLPAILTDNQKPEHSYQSLESENICLKKTVAQFQKDFLRMEAHCVNLELKYQNQALKEGQHGQFSKVKSNEAKERGFAIAALKNELRKLTGNSVNTKFAKSSILGKPVLQPHRNQSVVRQPTAFKSERPRISKPRFASQVNVNNDLLKPVTTHYLPKERESAPAKPHHMIANLLWVPTGKIFTSSTTKVDSEPSNGPNEDITNQYECEQTLDVSAVTFNLSACTSFNPKRRRLRVSYALSWKPCQGDSLNLPDHRIHKDGDGDASFQLESNSLPHAHAQTTKTYYKHQDSRIKKAQELKTKTSANSDIKDLPLKYQVYQGRLLAIFQDDARYEHVGQDIKSQGGKDDQD
ncbi:hypothetical protein Tco_0780510 [Tanacetum coccineum]